MTFLDRMKADAEECNERMRRHTGAIYNSPPGRKKCPLVAKRRQAVRRLREKGMARAEIAAALQVSVKTVKSDTRIVRAEDAYHDDV